MPWHDPASRRRWLFSIIAVLTLTRLWVATRVGLGDVEAYYWTWSRELAPGYLDHGPMVAWLVRAGTVVIGHTPLGVRVMFIALSGLTMVLLATIAERLAGDLDGDDAVAAPNEMRAGLASLLALVSMPMFVVAGAAANPDVPLVFFEVAFIGALLAAGRQAESPGGWRLHAAAGLLAGLACLCKLVAAALALPLLGAALARPRGKRLSAAVAGLTAMLAAAAPWLWWNATHGWPTLRYHLVERHGHDGIGLSIANLGKLLGGQLLYASPGVVLVFGAALAWLWRRRAATTSTRRLLEVSAPLLLVAVVLILIVPGAEPHWTVPAFMPLVLGAGVALPRWWRLRRWRVVTALSLGFSALVAVLFHVHVLSDVGVRLMPDSYVPRYDLSNELVGWSLVGDAAAKLRKTRRAKSARKLIVSGAHYTNCAQLAFAARGRYRVVCPSPRLDQFDLLRGGDGSTLRGVDLLYVRDDRFPYDAQTLYRCAKTRPLHLVRVRRGGRLVRRFVMQLCEGFSGLRIARWPPPAASKTAAKKK